MFSRALYRQSWKSNWIIWLSTTLVSMFVLIIIMTLLGSQGLSDLTTSFTETVIKEELESEFKTTGLNYYILTDDSLESFDKAFIDGFLIELSTNTNPTPEELNLMIASSYEYAINELTSYVANTLGEVDQASYEEYYGAVMFSLNPNNMFNELYELYEIGSSPNNYDIESLIMPILSGASYETYYDIVSSSDRIIYRNDRALYSSSIYLAGNMNQDFVIEEILTSLKEQNITLEVYQTFNFDYDGLKHITTSAILTFSARIEYEISNNSDGLSNQEIIDNLKADITKNFLSSLPDTLTSMLNDMGSQDTYTATLVSMYYKIVGILISIIYIIMVSVNLIAGSVDSGSMAYILSTGTKRKAVSFTQSIFLVSSSFFMHLATTITSIIVYLIKTPVASEMNVSKLLMFGLGTFLISFAFAGINFLTSSIINRSRQAMAIGGGITILQLIFTILGIFGSDVMPEMMKMEVLNFFNYLSLITLVDANDILNNSINLIWKFGILVLVGITTTIIGSHIFKKKDLPL